MIRSTIPEYGALLTLSKTLVGTVPILIVVGSAAAAPTITPVPLIGGALSNGASCLSPNGLIVAGSQTISPNSLYLWGPLAGLTVIPKPAPWFHYQADALNLDGSAIVGYCTLGNPLVSRAFRWTQATGCVELGTLGGDNSWAQAISADGLVVAGRSWTGGAIPNNAFRWTLAGGMQPVPLAPGMTNTFGYGMNQAGNVIVGGAYTNLGEVAFRWTSSTGTQSIGPGTGNVWGAATATSADGSRVAGYSGQSCYNGFLWIDGQGTQLFAPFGNYQRITPRFITPDGAAIGCNLQVQCGLSDASNRAGIWTQSMGMVELGAHLTQQGLNLSGWVLNNITGVSNDGTVLCGNGLFNGQQRGWYVSGISPICGPWIALQPPSSLSVCLGGSTPFSVQAFSPFVPGHITFQWHRQFTQGDGEVNRIPISNGTTAGGSVISGAQTPNMQLTNAVPSDAGKYVCLLTAGCGSTWTVVVDLKVVPGPPGIMGSPASATKCTFKTVSFNASAGPLANSPFTAVWTKGGVAVNLSNPRFTVNTSAGGLTSTLTITSIQLSDQTAAGNGYRCEFTNPCASSITAQAQLVVLPDLDNSGAVDTGDLTILLGSFSASVTPYTNGDLNGDGVVNTLDLTILLGAFSSACN